MGALALRVKGDAVRLRGMERILLVQTGTTRIGGDYPRWFEEALGFALPLARAHEGEKLAPALQKHRAKGIIVTGSPLSVTERAPWMLELGAELLRAGASGTPVLGVCFGHQLLGEAAGGKTIVNPRGREIGTVAIHLSEAARRDPLFAWASGDIIHVQATHLDAVDPLPPGATLLASNENSAQAMRLSETVAGVQFHPELSAPTLRELIRSRQEKLAAEGRDAEELAANVREVQAGQILRAFVEQVRRA